jgi:hypothetical protein
MKRLATCVVAVACSVALIGCTQTTKKGGTGTGTGAAGTHTGTGTAGTHTGTGTAAKNALEVKTNHDSYTIKQGETDDVKVTIKRDGGWDEDVSVKFDNLPKGVKVSAGGDKIAKASTDGTFTLAADADAEPVDNHAVTLKVKGGGIEADHALKITVKKK